MAKFDLKGMLSERSSQEMTIPEHRRHREAKTVH